MVQANIAYWKSKSGKAYQRVQQLRRDHGCKLYDGQLGWLQNYFAQRLSNPAKNKLRLLDFGCGFGRVAHLCEEFQGIEYNGYDFSESMIDGLRDNPPRSLTYNFNERVKVAGRVSECFRAEKFDIILSIAVLIHNDEESAQRILKELTNLLAKNGEIILIENQLTNKTARCNLWHGGCWAHDFVAYTSNKLSISVDVTTLPDQAIYRIRRPQTTPKLSIIRSGATFTYPDLATFHAQAPPPVIIETDKPDFDYSALMAELHDAQELHAHQKQRADEAETLTVRLESELSTLKKQFQLGRNLIRASGDATDDISLKPNRSPRSSGKLKQQEPPWTFNSLKDQRFAHSHHPAFASALTTFTQEWVGIRAAAGSFPGHKLAISENHNWSKKELLEIFDKIDEFGTNKVVVHGLSTGMAKLLIALRNAMPHLRIYGVWHGSLSAWCYDDERSLARQFLRMADNGIYDKIHFLKRGHHILHEKAHAPLLPNPVPNYERIRLAPAWSDLPITCLFGAWNNAWKNMYTNLAGAASSKVVKKVFAYAPVEQLVPESTKVCSCPYTSRENHFALAASCDLALNVTTADCHPMLELEALAVGTPALRANLDLDFGLEHEYERLFTVTRPHNPAEIQARIEYLATINSKELEQIVASYRDLVTRTSFQRYSEFLEG